MLSWLSERAGRCERRNNCKLVSSTHHAAALVIKWKISRRWQWQNTIKKISAQNTDEKPLNFVFLLNETRDSTNSGPAFVMWREITWITSISNRGSNYNWIDQIWKFTVFECTQTPTLLSLCLQWMENKIHNSIALRVIKLGRQLIN